VNSWLSRSDKDGVWRARWLPADHTLALLSEVLLQNGIVSPIAPHGNPSAFVLRQALQQGPTRKHGSFVFALRDSAYRHHYAVENGLEQECSYNSSHLATSLGGRCGRSQMPAATGAQMRRRGLVEFDSLVGNRMADTDTFGFHRLGGMRLSMLAQPR